MTDANDIARAAAKRLAPQFGKDLPLTVEKVIHGAVKPGQFADPGILDVATFILGCAQFIYTMHKDSLGESEAAKRTIRLEVKLPGGVSEKTRDAVIAAVVDEAQNAKDKA